MEIVNNSYSDLLNYFDSRYGGDTEHTNYAHVIISMEKEDKVSSLVKTYNKVLHKILLIYYRSEENFPSYWVEFMTEDQQWLWEDLKAYLNEQIRRVFDETEYSDQLALECITNLREGRNEATIRKHIASMSSEEVNVILKQVVACKKTVHDAPKHMSQFNMETNEYREYKPKYINDIKFLIKNGYHKGYNDVYYEMQSKISYLPDTKSIVYIILTCIVLIPIILLLIKYVFIGIFGVLCILALIRMLK
ncbi:MAG: hypothetical protein IKH32_09705 [Prevotella sp.]|nr:hypothetical protein [Prevotella sp.]